MVLRYFSSLNSARVVLWCYLLWYLSTAARCFDPSPRLWLTSLGLSGIIGFGLFLSTTQSGAQRTTLSRWQIFRLFLMPFCVSSFAALVKDKGYLLIFSPHLSDNLSSLGLCAGLVLFVLWSKRGLYLASFTSPAPTLRSAQAPREKAEQA
jgi:hypothetical protein